MELQFKGITEQEENNILPAWAYTKEEIKTMIQQHIDYIKPIEWTHKEWK